MSPYPSGSVAPNHVVSVNVSERQASTGFDASAAPGRYRHPDVLVGIYVV